MPSVAKRELIISCIADSHEWHRALEIRPCDLLLHAGDATYLSLKQSSIDDFETWIGEVPAPKVIFVPGNHDHFAFKRSGHARRLQNVTTLINEGIEVMGLRIWGCPVMPLDDAIALRPIEQRRRVYDQIPEQLDILVTHFPPYGILDSSDGGLSHGGCRELLKSVLRAKPKVHIFGHVHGAQGIVEIGNTTFINATVLDAKGGVLQPMTFCLRHK
jgi:Icc-related predicted phosphoesterase